ncbi:hypothetical protein PCE1_001118 [Barthelona sp. PCE]
MLRISAELLEKLSGLRVHSGILVGCKHKSNNTSCLGFISTALDSRDDESIEEFCETIGRLTVALPSGCVPIGIFTIDELDDIEATVTKVAVRMEESMEMGILSTFHEGFDFSRVINQIKGFSKSIYWLNYNRLDKSCAVKVFNTFMESFSMDALTIVDQDDFEPQIYKMPISLQLPEDYITLTPSILNSIYVEDQRLLLPNVNSVSNSTLNIETPALERTIAGTMEISALNESSARFGFLMSLLERLYLSGQEPELPINVVWNTSENTLPNCNSLCFFNGEERILDEIDFDIYEEKVVVYRENPNITMQEKVVLDSQTSQRRENSRFSQRQRKNFFRIFLLVLIIFGVVFAWLFRPIS